MNRTEAERLVDALILACQRSGRKHHPFTHNRSTTYRKKRELRKKIIDALCSSQTTITTTAETGTLFGVPIGTLNERIG